MTAFFNERGKAIATTLAETGWQSPLEPLAGGGDISALWERLEELSRPVDRVF